MCAVCLCVCMFVTAVTKQRTLQNTNQNHSMDNECGVHHIPTQTDQQTPSSPTAWKQEHSSSCTFATHATFALESRPTFSCYFVVLLSGHNRWPFGGRYDGCCHCCMCKPAPLSPVSSDADVCARACMFVLAPFVCYRRTSHRINQQ